MFGDVSLLQKEKPFKVFFFGQLFTLERARQRRRWRRALRRAFPLSLPGCVWLCSRSAPPFVLGQAPGSPNDPPLAAEKSTALFMSHRRPSVCFKKIYAVPLESVPSYASSSCPEGELGQMQLFCSVQVKTAPGE